MLRSSWTALSCYCVIAVGDVSASANFLLTTLLNPLLNFSTKTLPLYPLPLAALLNSCTYSSTVLFPCSSGLSSSTFRLSLLNSPNFCQIFMNNSSTVFTSNVPFVISSRILSFQISAILPCTYNNTQLILLLSPTCVILICMNRRQAWSSNPV